MQTNNDKSKHSLLEQVKAVLASRMSSDTAKQAAFFSDVYFKRMPLANLNRETPEVFAGMVSGQLEFLQQRKPGELLIRIFNPERGSDGWDCPHTIVEMVNDDMPFLVDTASMVMQELDLDVHLIIHPVLNVERDAKARLKSFHPKAGKQSETESFIHIHIDKQTDPTVLASVKSRLKSRMAKVRLTVADWQLMKESLEVTIAEFGRNAPDLSEDVRKECVDFLKWLDNDHFMFIGARTYDIVQDKKNALLKVVDGTGLGLLREHVKSVLSRPLADLGGETRFSPNAPLIISKTMMRSPMHRSGYMDYIGVLRFDKNGKVIGGVETFRDITLVEKLRKEIEQKYSFEFYVFYPFRCNCYYCILFVTR